MTFRNTNGNNHRHFLHHEFNITRFILFFSKPQKSSGHGLIVGAEVGQLISTPGDFIWTERIRIDSSGRSSNEKFYHICHKNIISGMDSPAALIRTSHLNLQNDISSPQ